MGGLGVLTAWYGGIVYHAVVSGRRDLNSRPHGPEPCMGEGGF